MKKFLITLTSLLFISTCSQASSNTIKIAIVDNLRSQKLSSINYENDYLAGVQAGMLAAKKQGVHIDYKYFKYGKGSLDILQEIPKIKAWSPDYIIGPRFSDKFLILKPYFSDVIVVSPLASASNLTTLPANYFSLSLKDRYTSIVISRFINKQYPKAKQVFILSAIDCKSCTDIGINTATMLKNSEHTKNIIQRNFFSDEIENIDIAKLVAGFQQGDIIVTPNISYVSSILLARIANHLKIPNIVFIGGDGWASSSVAYVGKIETEVPFIAYHLSQWPLEIKSKHAARFRSDYSQLFKMNPHDTISYATYETTTAAVAALKYKNPTQETSTSKKLIFDNFRQIASTFRSNTYAVYKLNKIDESVFDIIHFNNEK